PHYIEHDHHQDTERADEETGTPAGAKGKERDHTRQGTDDKQESSNIDGPVPDTAGVGNFGQVVKVGEEPALVRLHGSAAVCSVDCYHRAFARRGKRYLYLIWIFVIIGGR